jgi:hypothetical protein
MSTPDASPPQPSKGIALTNWLVRRTSQALERGTSRRGFLIGSAMVGSAVVVAGCSVATTPGTPYTFITDCSSGFCTDGYTEFCCAVNNGVNACPPGSFAGGWWRADSSSFCGGGTRYYIDCMQTCCGPPENYCQNGFCFCVGCTECRCAAGCNTRRVYCNYFRYGQCHQEIPTSGPIACRVVTCTPPYTVAAYACTTAPAVDNSTAEHAANCAVNVDPAPPIPVVAALPLACSAVSPASGDVSVFVRGNDSKVWYRDFNGSWGPWTSLGMTASSGPTAASFNGTTILAVLGTSNAVFANVRTNGAWSGWSSLGGLSRSDPVAVADPQGAWLFVRGGDDALYGNRYNGTSWSGWTSFGGAIISEPAATYDVTSGNTHVVAVGVDQHLYSKRFTTTAAVGDWVQMSGTASSDPAVTADSSGVIAFVRGPNLQVYFDRWTSGGGWAGWTSLGGVATSDPTAMSDGTVSRVFVRSTDNGVWSDPVEGSSGLGWQSLQGGTPADPVAVQVTPTSLYVFASGNDNAMWYGTITNGAWSGWSSLAGGLALTRAIP